MSDEKKETKPQDKPEEAKSERKGKQAEPDTRSDYFRQAHERGCVGG